MGAILPLLEQLVAAAPGWINAGIDVAKMWDNVDAVVAQEKIVGDDQWNALEASIAQHKADFNAAAKD